LKIYLDQPDVKFTFKYILYILIIGELILCCISHFDDPDVTVPERIP